MNNINILSKSTAVLVAVLMVSVAFAVLDWSEESEAAVATPTMGVYICYEYETQTDSEGNATDVSTWVYGTGSGQNAYLAAASYLGAQSISFTADSSYTVTTTYTTINKDYGTFSAINGVSNTSSKYWHAFYYTASGSSDGWTEGSEAIGFYKPYSDYDVSGRTANIALFYGTDDEAASAVQNVPTSGLQSVVSVPQSSTAENASNYAVAFTFTFTYDTGLSKCSHVTDSLIGYGSDCALALKNAFDNLGCSDYTIYLTPFVTDTETGKLVSNANYGYITEVFGVSENSDVTDSYSDYWYWSLYVDGSYASFLAGFYSPVAFDSSYQCSAMTLDYAYSHWEFRDRA